MYYYLRCELDTGEEGYISYNQTTKEYYFNKNKLECYHFTKDDANDFINLIGYRIGEFYLETF